MPPLLLVYVLGLLAAGFCYIVGSIESDHARFTWPEGLALAVLWPIAVPVIVLIGARRLACRLATLLDTEDDDG